MHRIEEGGCLPARAGSFHSIANPALPVRLHTCALQAIMSFTPSYTAVVIWDKDRLLLGRESQQGMYDVTAWFSARTLTTLPFEIVQSCLFCVIM